MAKEFKLPELGENVESAEITRVLVSEGDTIEEDQPVIEIETGKATVEVPSEVSGKISKLHVSEGDSVKVGDVIITVEGEGDEEEQKEEPSEEKEKKEEPKEEEKDDKEEKREPLKTQAKKGGVVEFRLPELGENVESADITKVLVKEGDKVEKDDPVLEIETDKASVEVPSEVAGTVKEVKVEEGGKAKPGDVILVLESEDAEAEESSEEEPEADKKGEEKEKKEEKRETMETKAKSGGVVEFKLPDLGENIESADITKVLVKEGDKIEKDDPVLEIETDKASVEVPSEVAGTVKEVKVKEGGKAKTGDVILTVEAEGGQAEEKKEEKKKEEPKKEEKKPEKEDEDVKRARQHLEKKDITTEKQPGEEYKKIPVRPDMPEKIAPAAPTVRRFAREIGIDIQEVSGTGPGGRISINDVKAYSKKKNEEVKKSGGPSALGIKKEKLPDFSKWGDVEVKDMSNIRRRTAEHLSYAWASIPHVTQHDKADITELEKFRKQWGKVVEKQGAKLTVTSILLKVLAQAMKVYPQFNSSIDMDNAKVIYKKYFNVGVAVDTDRGLLVPVLRDVDKKSITKLSVELTELSKKARDGKLSLDDMQGGNISISNLGGIGGTSFTPVVNTPEVAILGVSRGAMEPVFIDGEFKPRLMLPLSLSYDHRIIDGADAARFLRWVVNALENPFFMSLEG